MGKKTQDQVDEYAEAGSISMVTGDTVEGVDASKGPLDPANLQGFEQENGITGQDAKDFESAIADEVNAAQQNEGDQD